jgi:ABC-type antimicrobial peptide transport system permease subunit
VVDDVRYAQLEEEAIPAVYFSRRQAPSSYGTIFVRAGTDPLSLLDNVRRTVAQLAPELPLFDVSTMAQRKAAATARTRVVLGLLAAFALTGLLLAVVGLYGVVAYAVAQRTRELGLRLALGAARRDVLGLVLTPPALLALGGIAAGAGGALLLTRFVRALLYGIEPGDPRVLSAATLLLVAVALIAAWVPARRATRVDPAMALKSD